MTTTAVGLAVVVLLQLAAGAAVVTADPADPAAEKPAPAASAPPDSSGPAAEATEPAEERDATPAGPLPGTGGRASVLIGGALLVAAIVHWRLTAPPPPKD